MKERPIIFNTAMVKSIMGGQKIQTRRIVKNVAPDNGLTLKKPTKTRSGTSIHVLDAPKYGLCPLGKTGDRLWVRETWQGPLVDYDKANALYKDPVPFQLVKNCVYRADNGETPEYFDADDNLRYGWRPSIHMPRWASRISLEITNVHVERLKDISEEDAIAEGIITGRYGNEGNWLNGFYIPGNNQPHQTAKSAYRELWQSIYGEGSWFSNPWVWVIEFKPEAA
ncbi:hypothetical protein [Morganella psychrotolerans]|uniref:Morphogenetic protein n=1 Tax=Morganella psychrotolerans TaxID=368603 RepID=A0A1B8H6W3_9GAMM|nr:hypothetical protein [Morganella psychrotolerans]OBU04811.1 hypothetical protein AYY17_07910 [Morganella psychrotolerans]